MAGLSGPARQHLLRNSSNPVNGHRWERMQWILRHLHHEAKLDLDDVLRPYVIPLNQLPAQRVHVRTQFGYSTA